MSLLPVRHRPKPGRLQRLLGALARFGARRSTRPVVEEIGRTLRLLAVEKWLVPVVLFLVLPGPISFLVSLPLWLLVRRAALAGKLDHLQSKLGRLGERSPLRIAGFRARSPDEAGSRAGGSADGEDES